jgi:hypothetical protein
VGKRIYFSVFMQRGCLMLDWLRGASIATPNMTLSSSYGMPG